MRVLTKAKNFEIRRAPRPSTKQPDLPQLSAADSRMPIRAKYLRLTGWAKSQEHGSDKHGYKKPLSPDLQYDKAWNEEYHAIVHGGKIASLDRYPLSQWKKNDLLSGRLTGPSLSRSDVRTAWLRLRPSHRFPLWRVLILWCLQNSPRRALQLLVAALEGTYIAVPRHVAAECLQSLAIHYIYRGKKLDTWAFHALLRAVHSFVDRGRKSQLTPYVPDQVCFLLFKHCNEQQFMSLMGKFKQRGVQVRADTLLQAVDRSLRIGDVTLALQLLKAATQSGANPSSLQVQKACAKLVRAQFDSPHQFAIRMKIFSDILEMGVRPNLIVHKAVLFNTFEGKQTEFGIQILKAMEEGGLEPDAFIYMILLQGAMRDLDQSKVRMLIRKVEHSERLLEDSLLTTTVLRAIARKDSTSYGALLRFYKRHWDLQPLRELGIADEAEQPPASRQEAVRGKFPRPIVVSQLLCVYLRANWLDVKISAIYSCYQRLIRDEHPLISRIGSSDHVANAFLLCFSHSPRTLSLCATVMRDMLDASRSQRLSIKPEQTGVTASPPTVRTWSLLAAAYFEHGQKQAAEKVLDLMRERGIERMQVTWDLIIDGYASLQDVKKAVDTIVEMREAGSTITKRTVRSLRKINNQERLSGAFRDVIDLGSDAPDALVDSHKVQETKVVTGTNPSKETPDIRDTKNIARLQDQYLKMKMEREPPTTMDHVVN